MNRLLALLCLPVFLLAACGDDDDNASTSEGTAHTTATTTPEVKTSPKDAAAIASTYKRYVNATTPAAECKVIAAGLAGAIGGGPPAGSPSDPAGAECEAQVKKGIEEHRISTTPPPPGTAKVQDVAARGRLAVIRVPDPAGKEPYRLVYFVKTGGRWLVFSDGQSRGGNGFDPLEAQVRP